MEGKLYGTKVTRVCGGQVQVWVPVASSKRQGQAAGRKLRFLRGSDTGGASTQGATGLCWQTLSFYLHICRGLLLEESRVLSWGFWRVKATQVQWVFKEVVWLLSQTEKMHS